MSFVDVRMSKPVENFYKNLSQLEKTPESEFSADREKLEDAERGLDCRVVNKIASPLQGVVVSCRRRGLKRGISKLY